MVIAIGGMHRSGTSMLARVLNLAGLDLGATDDMIPEDPDFNAKGHWEHRDFVGVSEKVMEILGGEPITPPMLVDDWFTIPDLGPARDRASELIAKSAARGASAWGWKDPRVSVTGGFWKGLIPEMRFVCCVRNPMDVASSLHRRDKVSLSYSHALWYFHTDMLLTDIAAPAAVICHYEEMIRDWKKALPPLLEAVGLPAVEPGSQTERAIDELIDSGLKHFDTTAEDLYNNPDAGDDTKKLYAGLLNCPTGSIANVNRNIPARIAAHANFMREHNGEVRRMRSWAHELDTILKEGPPAVRVPTRDLIAIVQSRVAKRFSR